MTWRDCKLGDVLTLKRGHDLPEHLRESGDVPVVSSSGITGNHKEAKAPPPGVVTGRYGTLGEVYYLEEPYWPLNTALYVIDFKGNDPRFVAYFLKNALRGYRSDKAAVPGVDRNVLHELKVRAPSKNDQVTIAAMLSAYDDLIVNNSRRIALLEQSMRLLFKEWFVRLRYPGHEHDNVVGGVPNGWKKMTIDELVKIESGFAFKSASYVEDGLFGVVTIKNVQDGKFDAVCDSRLQEIPQEMPSHCVLSEGDILLSLTGNIGRVCVVHGEHFLLNQRVAKLISRDAANKSFVYFFFRDADTRKRLEGISAGVAQQNLSPIKMGTLELILPTDDLIREFSDFCNPIIEQTLALTKMNYMLEKSRDLLLPRLMDGRIAV
jgi:type I restriction enzyme S subunit